MDWRTRSKALWIILCIAGVSFATYLTILFPSIMLIGLIVEEYSFDFVVELTVLVISILGMSCISLSVTYEVLQRYDAIYHWSDRLKKLKC